MKTLYIVRHAKSSWEHADLDDFERPLNDRGHRDAIAMGKVLRELKVVPNLIIASPANRASMTAKLLSEQMKYPLDRIRFEAGLYLATQRGLCKVLKAVSDSCNHLMIIGHNPGLTALIHDLSGDPLPNLPTCGVYAIQVQVRSWEELHKRCGKKVFYEFPHRHDHSGGAD